jgi:hypothetical protein
MSEYHEVPGTFRCAGCGREHASHTPPVQIDFELYAPECVPDNSTATEG